MGMNPDCKNDIKIFPTVNGEGQIEIVVFLFNLVYGLRKIDFFIKVDRTTRFFVLDSAWS